VPFAKYDFFKTKGVAKGAASLLHSILPPSNNKKSNYNYFYRLIDLASKNSIATYLSSTFDNFEGYEKFLENGDSYLKEVSKDFDAINNSKLSGLQKIMNLDFDNILAGNLLVKMDIATMAHSLEGRSPLLCKELLEYVPSINDSFKIRGTQTKYILRQLAVKYLPDALINQPKRGFEVPLKKWMDNELKEIVFSYLGSANSYANNFVDKKFIQQLLDKKLKISDEKRAKMLYTLFALNVWHKKCFKNGS
jgi:asparagine synthase (glutamine-hydrolysing)